MAAPKTAPLPPKPPAPPAPAAVEENGAAVDASKWDMGLDIPAGRVFGGGGRKPGEEWDMANMPVNASHLVSVDVSDSITDEKERNAYFTAEQKKAFNRVTSTIRRFRTQNEAYGVRNYTVRKVADEKYGWGIRFWRIADSAAAPKAVKK